LLSQAQHSKQIGSEFFLLTSDLCTINCQLGVCLMMVELDSHASRISIPHDSFTQAVSENLLGYSSLIPIMECQKILNTEVLW
jgi:hypothetical protein